MRENALNKWELFVESHAFGFWMEKIMTIRFFIWMRYSLCLEARTKDEKIVLAKTITFWVSE